MIASEKEAKLIYDNAGSSGRLIFSNSDLELVKLKLEPKAVLLPHRVAFAAVFHVVSGSGTFIYEGKEFSVGAGDSFSVKKDSERGFSNFSQQALEILVIKPKVER